MSRDGQPPTRSKPFGQPPSDPPTQSPAPQKAPAAPWVRLSGAGMELAFITVVFGAIGAVIDGQVQLERPVCSAIGGLLGFCLGMIRFIRMATSISQSQRAIESTRSFDAPQEVDVDPNCEND